jgi:N-methylhydantoinase A/oxoprolinase/acetone carboxylase beta subunit
MKEKIDYTNHFLSCKDGKMRLKKNDESVIGNTDIRQKKQYFQFVKNITKCVHSTTKATNT